MPSGRVHRRFNIVGIVYLILTVELHSNIWIVGIAYYFSTILMNPDNDMDGTKSDKTFWIWDKFWNLYSSLFNHRGISHWHGIGTLTRIVYVMAGLFISIGILNKWFFPYPMVQDVLHSTKLNKLGIDLLFLIDGIKLITNKDGLTVNIFLITYQTLKDILLGLVIGDSNHIELDRAVSAEKIKTKKKITGNIKKTLGLSIVKPTKRTRKRSAISL